MPEGGVTTQQVNNAWIDAISRYPDLGKKWGNTPPLMPDGSLNPEAFRDFQQLDRQFVVPPEPVNWREFGRDITAGIGGLVSKAGLGPVNPFQQFFRPEMAEELYSKQLGVEPRDMALPEDAGIMRRLGQPILPELGALGSTIERFFDPVSAQLSLNLLGRSPGGYDPYGQAEMDRRLREMGVGPMASAQAAYAQAPIPGWERAATDIAAQLPLELIPGYGVAGGLSRAAGRGLGAAGKKTFSEIGARRAGQATLRELERQTALSQRALGPAPPGTLVDRSQAAVEEAARQRAVELQAGIDVATGRGPAAQGMLPAAPAPPTAGVQQPLPMEGIAQQLELGPTGMMPGYQRPSLIPETGPPVPIPPSATERAQQVVDTVATMSNQQVDSLVDEIADEVFVALPAMMDGAYHPWWAVQGRREGIAQQAGHMGSVIGRGDDPLVPRGGFGTAKEALVYPKQIVKDTIRGQHTEPFALQQLPEDQIILDAAYRTGKISELPPTIPEVVPTYEGPPFGQPLREMMAPTPEAITPPGPISSEDLLRRQRAGEQPIREQELMPWERDLAPAPSPAAVPEPIIGLTKEESRQLTLLKGRLSSLDEQAELAERFARLTPGSQEWRQMAHDYPQLGRKPGPMEEGYRPPPPPTAAERASRIADATEDVTASKEVVTDATEKVRIAKDQLDAAKDRGLSKEYLADFRADLAEERISLREAKESLTDANAQLRLVKEPFDMEAYNKAIAAADEYDASEIEMRRRITNDIAELEAKQGAATVPPRMAPEVQTSIEEMRRLRQQGVEGVAGVQARMLTKPIGLQDLERHYDSLLNQTAESLGMTTKEVNDYIDSLEQIPFQITMEPSETGFQSGFRINIDSSANQALNLAEIAAREGNTPAGREAKSLLARLGEQMNRQAREARLTSPESPGPIKPRGALPADEEKTLALVRNREYPKSNTPPVSEQARDWRIRQISIEDGIEGGVRGWMTPEERLIFDEKGLPGLSNETRERLGKDAVGRYEGAVRAQDDLTNEILLEGYDRLEKLGFGIKKIGVSYASRGRRLIPKDEDWGTLERPGPIMILYKALHDPEQYLGQVRQLGSGWEDTYNHLKDFARVEEMMRIDFDPNIAANIDNYFYRGWRLPEDAREGAFQRLKQILGREPSFRRQRARVDGVQVTFDEMLEAGFRPLYTNPYEQATFSMRMGTHFRLQDELLLWLKKAGIAEPVEDARFMPRGYRVPNLGVVFEGKGYEIRNVTRTGEPGAMDQVVHRMGQYAVPDSVADVMETIFRGGIKWKKEFYKKVRLGTWEKELRLDPDDIIFLPKRMKLFGSVFQQVDFATRMGIGGTHAFMDAVEYNRNTLGMSKRESLQAAMPHLKSIPIALKKSLGLYFKQGSRDHMRKLMQTGQIGSDGRLINPREALIPDTTISWSGLRRNNLMIYDQTLIPKDDLLNTFKEAYRESGLTSKAKAPFRALKELEYLTRRGLFEGWYPGMIMTDVEHNILPIVRRALPKATDEQVMAVTARVSNLRYSVIPVSQSVMQGAIREMALRFFFSVNEMEALIRQFTRGVPSPLRPGNIAKETPMGVQGLKESAFWRKNWAGTFVFMATLANGIHYFSTATEGIREAGGDPRAAMPSFMGGQGKFLPLERYTPIVRDDHGLLPIGYNARFMRPDVPFLKTRSGENALWDLMGQMDTAFRLLEWKHFPFDGFLQSRQNVPINAALNYMRGTDYFGRSTDKWGYVQKMLQLIYDIAAPIGIGGASMASIKALAGDAPLPAVGSRRTGQLIAPGATVQDILPTTEVRLGTGAQWGQATGINLSADTNDILRDKMARNKVDLINRVATSDKMFDSGVRWEDLDIDHTAAIYEAAKDPGDPNYQISLELDRRLVEGTEQGNPRLQVAKEFRDARDAKMNDQRIVVDEHIYKMRPHNPGGPAFDPQDFKDALHDANLKHRTRIDRIEDIYSALPQTAQIWIERATEPTEEEQLRRPVAYAMWQYYQLRQKHRNEETGQTDWNAFDRDFVPLFNSWDDEIQIRYDNYMHRTGTNHPEIQAYYDDMETLEEAGYFDLGREPDYVGYLEQQQPGLTEKWQHWLDSSSNERERLEAKGSYWGPAIRILKKRRTDQRTQMRKSDTNIDRITITWFDNVPTRTENIKLYRDLHGKNPGRMDTGLRSFRSIGQVGVPVP